MKKLIAYPLTVIYYLCFGLSLVIFHPIQWICLNLFGYQAHKKSVDYLNFLLVSCLYILGTKIKFKNPHNLSREYPYIIVSNHQSMNDIPPLIWFFGKLHPKFVAKIELGKGIPSISYNLKHGGSALINRKDPVQSLNAIVKMAKNLEERNRSVVIFPEGTRSRTGEPKRFSENGLKKLIEHMPSAYVLPVTINNSYKLLQYGGFPMKIGVPITIEVHKPIKVNSMDFKDLFPLVENTIKSAVKLT